MPTTAVHPFTSIHAAYNDPDLAWFDNHNRERTDTPAEDWLVDGLVPIGAMVLYADPGAGKSMVVQQVIHHLAYGRPLGPWGLPQAGGHIVHVFDLEADATLSRDRSYNITPYGELPQDGNPDRDDNYVLHTTAVIPPPAREAWSVITSQPERHAQYLEQVLDEAAADGKPIRMVVIDTLTKFVGPKPTRAAGNAYEYEAAIIDRLNRIALNHRCAIVIVHHTNKAGEISGSQGIGGSATVTCKLRLNDRTEEDDEQGVPVSGVLVSTKVRIGAPFRYQIEQRDDGVWEFVDRPASESEQRGHARAILAALSDGPKTRRELVAATGIGPSIDSALNRMRKARLIFTKYGQWHPVKDDRRTVPGQADGVCAVCGGPMTITEPGQTTHPGCDPGGGGGGGEDPRPPVAPEPGGGEQEEKAPTGTAFKALEASILRSRLKPVTRFPKAEREQEPWTLVTERMTGEHAWARHPADVAEGAAVLTLDRNGSYPSAMSSVPVVANRMHHTGHLDELPEKTAGIFRIPAVPWDSDLNGLGHPLGKIARQDADEWWVTTPHLLLLRKLAAEGLVPAPVILDSWTGRSATSLFEAFSRQVRDDRESARLAGDSERLADVKRASSIAIRSLWPKQAQSPFWRPDWSVAVRAEAAVRHWWRARQCTTAGETVVKLGAVDEVAILSNNEEPPFPYVIGPKFGQVKVKDHRLYVDWKADRGNRAR